MALKIASTIREIINGLPEAISTAERDAFVVASLARAISLDLQLPASPVDSIDFYYAGVPNASATEIVAAINEEVIVDVTQLMGLIRHFYTLRYNLVHQPRLSSAAFAAAIAESPDSVPGAISDVMAKFNTQDAQRSFDHLVWAFKQDFVQEETGVSASEVEAIEAQGGPVGSSL